MINYYNFILRKTLIAAIGLSLFSCNSPIICNAFNQSLQKEQEEILALRDGYRKHAEQKDFSIICLRNDELSKELLTQDDFVHKNSLLLNDKESDVVTECLLFRAGYDKPEPTAPSDCILWDEIYWVLSRGEKALYIGPHGENHFHSIVSPFIWHYAKKELLGAMQRAKKKASERAQTQG